MRSQLCVQCISYSNFENHFSDRAITSARFHKRKSTRLYEITARIFSKSVSPYSARYGVTRTVQAADCHQRNAAILAEIHFRNSDVKNSCLDITLLSTAIVKIRERFSAEIHRNRRCRYLIMIMLMTTITSKAEGPTGYIISEVFGTKAVLTQRIE